MVKLIRCTKHQTSSSHFISSSSSSFSLYILVWCSRNCPFVKIKVHRMMHFESCCTGSDSVSEIVSIPLMTALRIPVKPWSTRQSTLLQINCSIPELELAPSALICLFFVSLAICFPRSELDDMELVFLLIKVILGKELNELSRRPNFCLFNSSGVDAPSANLFACC